MSLTDDQHAEIEAKLDAAWNKCFYGRKYSPAYKLAHEIKSLRILAAQSHERKFNDSLNTWALKWRAGTAEALLGAAITSSKKLRQVADALDAKKTEDPRQAAILKAYTDCSDERYPPTLRELQQTYVKRFRKEGWPADQSVRKTLRMFDLPLRKAKRGPPWDQKRSELIGNRERRVRFLFIRQL